MIRKFKKEDIEEVSRIWLDTNIKSHNFIDKNYWKDNFKIVKDLLLKAEIYVYEDEKGVIKGFIGLNNNYIEGIFVCENVQSKGIGKKLVDYAKQIKSNLSLKVYKKNIRAIKFYQRENFEIKKEGIDEDTGEEEYFMEWDILRFMNKLI